MTIETVPDGSTLLLHHYTYGVVLALLGTAVVWDNYRDVEPFLVTLALVVGLLGFVFGWNTSPELGALLSLVGATAPVVLVLADLTVGTWLPWDRYPLMWSVWVLFWSLFALDDAISHAFGVWTPLDWLFHTYIWGPVL